MGILRYIINSGDWEWFEWFSWHPNINTLLQDHTVAYYLLQRAVIENNTGSIKYVVMVCDVDINALHAAAIQSFSEEAKTLSLDTDKRSLLELALISHSYDAMDILLHFGATPVVALPTGGITSILHSYYICQPYMELLIHKYGFPIDARCPSGSGQTPLCCALSQRWSVVERTSMLLDFGAQINGIPVI